MEAAWSRPTALNVFSGARLAKRALASALGLSGVLELDLRARGSNVVIAVAYHGTPSSSVPSLSEHFDFYSRHFASLGEDEMLRFLRGEQRLEKPGIVLSFDDGTFDHAAVAAPLLRRFGLRGWFMIPGGCLQEAAHPGSGTMTWEMARGLVADGHVVGCHSWSHRTLGTGVPEAIVEEEVGRAKRAFEERLGSPVRTFAWVRGRIGDYSSQAHRAIARTFELSFTSLARAIQTGDDPRALHRFHVESSFPLDVVRFQMSRFNEVAFARRRRAVLGALR